MPEDQRAKKGSLSLHAHLFSAFNDDSSLESRRRERAHIMNSSYNAEMVLSEVPVENVSIIALDTLIRPVQEEVKKRGLQQFIFFHIFIYRKR